jgi:type VI secretion system protein ImpJ
LEALQEGFSMISFAKEDRVFKVDLESAWMADKVIIGVKGSLTMPEKDLIEWATSCVIATRDYVAGVRDKRILGASRQLISGSKALRLMPSKDMVLLEVVYDRSFINVDDELQIFNVADTPQKRPSEIVMYVPKKTDGKKKI